jgi:hypothetical protein
VGTATFPQSVTIAGELIASRPVDATSTLQTTNITLNEGFNTATPSNITFIGTCTDNTADGGWCTTLGN